MSLGSCIQDVTIGHKKVSSDVDVFEYESLPVYEARLQDEIVITINHTQGIALIPPVRHLQQDATSQGIRILNESWIDMSYVLRVEGQIGADYLLDIHDPSHRVTLVKGAEVLARDGDHLVLAVSFTGEKHGTEYSRKEIHLVT